jgi:hypothetical protein
MYHTHARSAVEGGRGLGWASLAIGLAELAAPKQVQSALGLEDSAQHRGILRVLGIRELMHGISLLTERRPSEAMNISLWGRVAGDVLDTALLGVAATKTKKPVSFAATASSVLLIGLLDTMYATRVTGHRAARRAFSWS